VPGQAVCSYAQSARWVLQLVAGTLGEVFGVGVLARVRDGQAMTQGGAIEPGSGLAGGSGCGWRRFAGVSW